MMPAVVVVGLVALAAIGAVRLWLKVLEARKKISFAQEYANKFSGYARRYVNRCIRNTNPPAKDRLVERELYGWLIQHVNKMKRVLGAKGIIVYAHPAAGMV